MPKVEQFPGSATLDDTRRACKVFQQDETARLTKIEGIINDKEDGTEVKLNQATFEKVGNVLKVKELKFIDVSTNQGIADALAANATHNPLIGPNQNEFEIWVEDELTKVQVFAKK